jgi:hypothetical protein
VSRAQELARVGLALFGMARTLEQGQSKPAAEALDGILAQLLRVALDFLARTFGLDKLPKLLRVGLQALRRPVEKGVNGVLDKIIRLAQKAWQGVKKGRAAAAQAGKQAVGAVKGWLGIHETFPTADGATHELYFRAASGGTELVRASTTPKEIDRYLDEVEQAARKDGRPIPPELTLARMLAGSTKLITRTATTVGQTPNSTKDEEQSKLVPKIHELAHLLYNLLPISATKGPPAPEWSAGVAQYTGGAKQSKSVKYLTKNMVGSGREPTGTSEEYEYMRDPAVFANRQYWVRMHLVSKELGHGEPDNWIAAPNYVNTGNAVLHSFENSAKALVLQKTAPPNMVPAGTPSYDVVLWMEVRVDDYHRSPAITHPVTGKALLGFAKNMTFQYGLMLPPRKPGDAWTHVDRPLSHQIVRIPSPLDTNIYLNQTTRTKVLDAASNPVIATTAARQAAHHLNNSKYGAALRKILVDGAKQQPYEDVLGGGHTVKTWLDKKMPASRNGELSGPNWQAIRNAVLANIAAGSPPAGTLTETFFLEIAL